MAIRTTTIRTTTTTMCGQLGVLNKIQNVAVGQSFDIVF
jgi:hypothetical protein